MLLGSTLEKIIEEEEFMFYEVNTRAFGENSLMRGGYMFEEPYTGDLGYLYVCDVIDADLIMKNENKIYECYVPRIEKALKAILSHSRKIKLEPDEWPVMIEIAQRVKENLPDLVVVPNGKNL